MTYFRFWQECLRWAFPVWGRSEPLLEQAPAALLILFTSVSGVSGVAGVVQAWRDAELAWLFLLLPFIFLTVVVAPYQLWESASVQLMALTTPRLLVSLNPKDPRSGAVYRTLSVRNPTAHPVKDCYGKLVRMVCQSDPLMVMPGGSFWFPWTTRHGQKSTVVSIGAFDDFHLDIAHSGGDESDTFDLPGIQDGAYVSACQFPKGIYLWTIHVGSTSDSLPPTSVAVKVTFLGGRSLEIESTE